MNRFARLLGRAAADVVAFFRDKPIIPCQVDWDYRGHFIDPAFSHHDEDDDISVDLIAEWRKPRQVRQAYPNE